MFTLGRLCTHALCAACLQLVLEAAAEGVLQEWLARINAAVAQQARRSVLGRRGSCCSGRLARL